ncbi:MAG: choice-of-anchor Q domain-containing protein [Acidobacteriota bacterium]
MTYRKLDFAAPACAVAALLLSVLNVVPAEGATYYVTRFDDAAVADAAPNSGSLRWCLDRANTNPGFDTIKFRRMASIMIVPETPYRITDSVAIYDNRSILIAPDGPGFPGGFVGDSIFEIGDGVAAVQVTLSGLHLLGHSHPQGPRAVEVRGGASLDFRHGRAEQFDVDRVGTVYGASGSTVHLTNATFADNSMREGGAVYVTGGSLDIVASTFHRNHSGRHGGAVYVAPGTRATISDSHFADNRADQRGGAVHHWGSSLDVAGGEYAGNRAVISGGAFNLEVGTGRSATLRDLVLQGNEALTHGGAIARFGGGSLTVEGTSVWANVSGDGGGIYLAGGANELRGLDLQENLAKFDGGGLWFGGGGVRLRVEDSAFVRNLHALGGFGVGGGLYAGIGDVSVVNSTFSANGHTTGSLVNGGGLAFDQRVRADLIHLTVTEGDAAQGGGVWSHPLSTLSIRNSAFGESVGGGDCTLFGSVTHSGSLDEDGSCRFTSHGGVALDLEPLGDYGGPTWTRPPMAHSKLVDNADPSFCPSEDQRGEPRPQGSACDVGAVEAH